MYNTEAFQADKMGEAEAAESSGRWCQSSTLLFNHTRHTQPFPGLVSKQWIYSIFLNITDSTEYLANKLVFPEFLVREHLLTN